jgi:glycosyltransferase involved in cell wall biosynthesis
MACDRPVLVSRGAAVHEVLTDGKDAILFPPREPAALAGKIALLMSRPDLRTQIARQGMELVRQQFNYDRFAGDVARLCEQLIQEKRDAKS